MSRRRCWPTSKRSSSANKPDILKPPGGAAFCFVIARSDLSRPASDRAARSEFIHTLRKKDNFPFSFLPNNAEIDYIFFSSPFFLRSAKRTAKAKRRARKRSFFLRLKLSRGSFPPSKTYFLSKKINFRSNFRILKPLCRNGFELFGFIYMFFYVKNKIEKLSL